MASTTIANMIEGSTVSYVPEMSRVNVYTSQQCVGVMRGDIAKRFYDLCRLHITVQGFHQDQYNCLALSLWLAGDKTTTGLFPWYSFQDWFSNGSAVFNDWRQRATPLAPPVSVAEIRDPVLAYFDGESDKHSLVILPADASTPTSIIQKMGAYPIQVFPHAEEEIRRLTNHNKFQVAPEYYWLE